MDEKTSLCDPLIRRKEDEESCKAGTLQKRLSPGLVKISELWSACLIGQLASDRPHYRLPIGITDLLEANIASASSGSPRLINCLLRISLYQNQDRDGDYVA
jgi:hypothetical protein